MSREDLRAIVLRIGEDDAFLTELNEFPWVAWEGYNLTQEEQQALIRGDLHWIEQQLGGLDEGLMKRLRWPPDAMDPGANPQNFS